MGEWRERRVNVSYLPFLEYYIHGNIYYSVKCVSTISLYNLVRNKEKTFLLMDAKIKEKKKK